MSSLLLLGSLLSSRQGSRTRSAPVVFTALPRVTSTTETVAVVSAFKSKEATPAIFGG